MPSRKAELPLSISAGLCVDIKPSQSHASGIALEALQKRVEAPSLFERSCAPILALQSFDDPALQNFFAALADSSKRSLCFESLGHARLCAARKDPVASDDADISLQAKCAAIRNGLRGSGDPSARSFAQIADSAGWGALNAR